MLKKITLLALVASVDAIKFALDNEEDEDSMTSQSISEAEAQHGAKLNMDDKTMKSALAENNRLNFKDDESFDKASKTWKSEFEYGLLQLKEGKKPGNILAKKPMTRHQKMIAAAAHEQPNRKIYPSGRNFRKARHHKKTLY